VNAPTERWQDGPDLVVMAAPLLVAGIRRVWPGRLDWPLRSMLASALLTLLIGAGLGKGDAVMLDRVAAANGYHYCQTLDVWDPHGSRGGGPALQSWGYSRTACTANRPHRRGGPGLTPDTGNWHRGPVFQGKRLSSARLSVLSDWGCWGQAASSLLLAL
jgi:hypothetical protein